MLNPFLHADIARALGWSVADTQSFSLHTLRELVRPVNPGLAEEITYQIRSGEYVTRPGRRARGRSR